MKDVLELYDIDRAPPEHRYTARVVGIMYVALADIAATLATTPREARLVATAIDAMRQLDRLAAETAVERASGGKPRPGVDP